MYRYCLHCPEADHIELHLGLVNQVEEVLVAARADAAVGLVSVQRAVAVRAQEVVLLDPNRAGIAEEVTLPVTRERSGYGAVAQEA